MERLHRQGVRVEVIAEITSDLNRRLLVKLFDLLAPPAIRDQGCLILMGSEGRGEQTVRTDQDNGLLLAGPAPEAELTAFRHGILRRARRLRLPALSRRGDGQQSAMVAAGRGAGAAIAGLGAGPPRRRPRSTWRSSSTRSRSCGQAGLLAQAQRRPWSG